MDETPVRSPHERSQGRYAFFLPEASREAKDRLQGEMRKGLPTIVAALNQLLTAHN